MVNSAKRLRGDVNRSGDAIGIRYLALFQQDTQRLGGDSGHVAGDDQVPIRRGHTQSRKQPADRTKPWNFVWYSTGPTDNDNVSSSFPDSRSDVVEQRHAAIGQRSLVPAHSDACPTRQNEPGRIHERMIAFGSRAAGEKES